MRFILMVAAALWVTGAVAQGGPEGTPEDGRITVTGEGAVQAVPDRASLRLGVTARGESAADAVAETAGAATAMLERLTGAGVPEKDIQTSNLRLQPVREDRTEPGAVPAIVGYEAATDLTVTTDDLDGIGALLDSALGAGATQFDGLSFELSDPTAARERARRAAVADARAKAETLAEAAGVTLGPVRSIAEVQSGGGPLFRADFARAEAAPMPVAPGQIEITTSVTIVFALTP